MEEGTVITHANEVTLTWKSGGTGVLSVYGGNACHQGNPSSMDLQVADPLLKPIIEKNECDTELRLAYTGDIEWYVNEFPIAVSGSIYQVADSGIYYVTIGNFCGSISSDPIQVIPLRDQQIQIPNVITPNADGKNDFLAVDPAIDNLILKVFGRSGDAVFTSNNYLNDWSGQGVPSGVYYLQVRHPCLIHSYKGWVQVIK
jgi:hypothetical protein